MLADAQANYDRLHAQFLRQRVLGNSIEDIYYQMKIAIEVIERLKEVHG